MPVLVVVLVALVLSLVPIGVASAQPVMVEKNLFAPDRKPPSDQPVEPKKTEAPAGLPPKSVQLDGVMVLGESKKALIRVRSQILGTTKTRDPFPYMAVKEGDAVGDYKVVTIDAKSVTLARSGQEYYVGLFSEGKIASPPTPLPAVAAPRPQAGPEGEPVSEQEEPVGKGVAAGARAAPPAEPTANVRTHARRNPRYPVGQTAERPVPNELEEQAPPEDDEGLEADE
jgi:hypothetical protein